VAADTPEAVRREAQAVENQAEAAVDRHLEVHLEVHPAPLPHRPVPARRLARQIPSAHQVISAARRDPEAARHPYTAEDDTTAAAQQFHTPQVDAPLSA